MTSCVNRTCRRPLASFSDGRLFRFEIVSISVSADDHSKLGFDEVPHREAAQFWLCGDCSQSMTLTLELSGGLQLVPLESAIGEPSIPAGDQFHELLGALQQS